MPNATPEQKTRRHQNVEGHDCGTAITCQKESAMEDLTLALLVRHLRPSRSAVLGDVIDLNYL